MESQHAPFKTVEWHLAYREQQRLRSDKTPMGIFLDKFTGRLHSWSNNPLSSFYHTESSAGISDPEKEKLQHVILEAEQQQVVAQMIETEARNADYVIS